MSREPVRCRYHWPGWRQSTTWTRTQVESSGDGMSVKFDSSGSPPMWIS